MIRLPVVCGVLVVFLLTLATPVGAVNIVWNTGSGLFGNAASWSPATVPGANDTAVFTGGFGPNVDFDANFTVGDISIDPGGSYIFRTVGPAPVRSLSTNSLTLTDSQLNLGDFLSPPFAFNLFANDSVNLTNGILNVDFGSRVETDSLSLFSDGGGPNASLGVFGGGPSGPSRFTVFGDASLESINGVQSVMSLIGGSTAEIQGALRVANAPFNIQSNARVDVSGGSVLSTGDIFGSTANFADQTAFIEVRDANSRIVQHNATGLFLGTQNSSNLSTFSVFDGGQFQGGSGGVHLGTSAQVIVDDFGTGRSTSFSTSGDVNIATDGGNPPGPGDALLATGQDASFIQTGGGNFTLGHASNGFASARVQNGAQMELDAARFRLRGNGFFEARDFGTQVTTTGTVEIGVAQSAGPVVFALLDVQNGATFTQVNGAGLTIGGADGPNEGALSVGGGGRFDAGSGPVNVEATGRIDVSDGVFETSGDVHLNTRGGLGGPPPGERVFLSGTGRFSQTGGGTFTLGSALQRDDFVRIFDDALLETDADVTIHSSGALNVNSFSGGPGARAIFGGNVAINPNGGDGINGRIIVDGIAASVTQTGNSTLSVGRAGGTPGPFPPPPPPLPPLEVRNGGIYTTGAGLTTIHADSEVRVDGGVLNVQGNAVIDGGVLNIQNGGDAAFAAGTTLTVQNGGIFDKSLPGAGITSIAHEQLLHVRSGGQFVSADDVHVGDFSSPGALTVEGAGTWMSVSRLRIGAQDGSGTAIFRDDARGEAVDIDVGGGIGGGFPPGLGDQASLVVESGARLNFNMLNVGVGGAAGGINNVVVTGADSRLTQTNPNAVTIGDPGGAQQSLLSVENGGTFTAMTFIDLHLNSTLRIDGGHVQAQDISLGSGGVVDFRAGSLELTSAGLSIAATGGKLGSDVNLSTAKSLTVAGPTNVQLGGRLSITGGSLTTSGLTIDGDLNLQSGSLSVVSPNPIFIGAAGKLSIADGASYTPTNNLTSFGEIFLGGPNAVIVVGNNLANEGVLSGNGAVERTVINMPNGEIRASFTDRILLAGVDNRNEGTITLSFGGTIESPLKLENTATGVIAGDGIIRVGQIAHNPGPPPTHAGDGLLSFGKLNFSGNTQVFGDVWVQGDGSEPQIIAAGGGTTVAFFDEVFSRPDGGIPVFRATEGTTIVYFDTLRGTVTQDGSGNHIVEGGTGGFSPSYQTATNITWSGTSVNEFDLAGVLRMDQTAAINFDTDNRYSARDYTNWTLSDGVNGPLIDVNLIPPLAPHTAGADFAPSLGDSFELVQYGTIFGDGLSALDFNFDDAPLSNPNWFWQIDLGSGANDSVTISVAAVPEPAAYILALIGLAAIGLFVRMRRRRAN